WGMSDRVGPMAWGGQGQVFLGEDLMHSREYSDETARVIDEEVERILREQEDRARETLRRHRSGLDSVARALLENETIDGAEVGRLVDEAAGRQVRRRPPAPTPAAAGAPADGAAVAAKHAMVEDRRPASPPDGSPTVRR
ncbi:MAG: hypothetical protein ABR511_05820, partial [Acidimicrobiales bacterium]